MRASTMTAAAPESFAPGAMPMLSSSVNSFGRSFAAMRSTARGTRGPSTARAKMNTVSVSATLVASTGQRRGGRARARHAPRRGVAGDRQTLALTFGRLDFRNDRGDLLRVVGRLRKLCEQTPPV